jgi:nicotinamide-nucleotide amidase
MDGPHESAAVLSIGDELILGQTQDTNARWLCQRLLEAGVSVREARLVPDDRHAIAAALQRLAASLDLVIVTGGLGPTADDLTRDALAALLGEPLVEDDVALAHVLAWFEGRGRPMPQINRVQARRPASASCIPNLHGTAPGLRCAARPAGHPCDVFCLPGPPGEMMPMWHAHVAPRLRPTPGLTVRTRALHCFGLGESDLATRLGDMMDRRRTPLIGTTASAGVVSCRLRYRGPLPPHQADELLDADARAIRRLAGPYLFGEGDQTLQDAVLSLAKAQAHTLGVVESCTAGLLGALLTRPPGSSAAFVGGLQTYSNDLKVRLAGVDPSLLAPGGPGAVSAEVASAMAQGGLERLASTHCLAITGIAGPDGAVPASAGRPAKPVGTVFIARATRGQAVEVRHFRFTGDREAVRDWACKAALAMLWQHLAGTGPAPMLREVR